MMAIAKFFSYCLSMLPPQFLSPWGDDGRLGRYCVSFSRSPLWLDTQFPLRRDCLPLAEAVGEATLIKTR